LETSDELRFGLARRVENDFVWRNALTEAVLHLNDRGAFTTTTGLDHLLHNAGEWVGLHLKKNPVGVRVGGGWGERESQNVSPHNNG